MQASNGGRASKRVRTATYQPNEKNKQRFRACKRCHERRSKCDASSVGLPCTKCKQVRNSDCRFVESKRTRGPAGRFVAPITTNENIAGQDIISPVQRHEDTRPELAASWSTTRTVDEVSITLDLSELGHSRRLRRPVPVKCGLEKSAIPGASASETPRPSATAPDPTYGGLFKCNYLFVGESWYASFLLRACNHENNKLQRLFEPSASGSESEDATSWVGSPSESAKLPPKGIVLELIEAYFSRFHVHFPFLDRANFIEDRASPELLRCVLFVGSMHCDEEVLHRAGYTSRTKAMDDLFNVAKDAVEARPDAHRFTQLQCAFLLHHWLGQPTVAKDSAWWLSTAIRFAQLIGMHRSTRDISADEATKSHYKRMWWCLYIRDRQMSLCLGVPMIINDLDCDVEGLDRNDFPDESHETAEYVIAQVNLTRIAANLYYCHLSPSRINLSTQNEYRQTAVKEILGSLQTWFASLPVFLQAERRQSHHGIALRILHNFWKIDFLLRLERKASLVGDCSYVRDCATEITRDVENAVLHWSPECFPAMIVVPAIFSAMTVQYVSAQSSYVNSDRKSLLSQQLRSNLLSLRQFEKCFIVARWIRSLFEDAMSRPARTDLDVSASDGFHIDEGMVGQSDNAYTTSEAYVNFPLDQLEPFPYDRQMAGMWSTSDVLQSYRDMLLTCGEQDWDNLHLKD